MQIIANGASARQYRSLERLSVSSTPIYTFLVLSCRHLLSSLSAFSLAFTSSHDDFVCKLELLLRDNDIIFQSVSRCCCCCTDDEGVCAERRWSSRKFNKGCDCGIIAGFSHTFITFSKITVILNLKKKLHIFDT
jgi:hypothetical protein